MIQHQIPVLALQHEIENIRLYPITQIVDQTLLFLDKLHHQVDDLSQQEMFGQFEVLVLQLEK
jgi:hypothetical protein